MSLTDRDLDDLFRGAELGYRPKFKPKYFRDIEAQLPIYKKSYIKRLFLIGLLLLIPLTSVRYLISESISSVVNSSSKNKTEFKHSAIKNTPVFAKKNNALAKNEMSIMDLIKSVEISDENGSNFEHKPLHVALAKPLFHALAINKPLDRKEIITHKLSKKPINHSSHNFALSMHGGMEQSWITNENNSVNGVFAIKAEYEKPIQNFSFNFGLGLQLTKFDDLKIEERTKIYDFSSSELEQSYKFGSMISVLVPVSVSYQMSKHRFEAGLNARANLMTTVFYKETLDNQTSKTSEGYTGVDLFNRFGIQPYLGYSYSINNKTSIGVNAGIALIKPTNSSRFKGDARNNPIEFNFYFKRNITWNR